MKKSTLYLAVVLSLAAGLLAVSAPPAAATFHLIKVREVYAGSTTNPTSQYIELQMYSPQEILLAGHTLTVYDATGKDVGDFTFPGIVYGANQAYILLATPEAESEFNVTADLAMTPVVPRSGGKICWVTDEPPPVDCVSWGNYQGPPRYAGNPFAPNTGIPPGIAMQRKISGGRDPNMLEEEDDTNDSAADFQLARPDPHSNSESYPISTPPSPLSTPPPSQKKDARTISLDIKHRSASGKVSVKDNFNACRSKVPVKLQKEHGMKWKTVDSGHTNKSGAYDLTAGDNGTFRALAPATKAGGDKCLKAVSKPQGG
ncbi:MAG: hypothetical protein ABR579_06910 [Actinomycetota bacterium]